MNTTDSSDTTKVSATDLASEFGGRAGEELNDALRTIEHCLRQLTDEQLWWRADECLNSVANLMLHLSGNVRQWIVSGVGGFPDQRKRPQEFNERGPIPRSELLSRLATTVADAIAVLSKTTAHALLETRCIQGFEVTCLQAVVHSVAHFRGHTQEIVHVARSLLRDKYEFALVLTEDQDGLDGTQPA